MVWGDFTNQQNKPFESSGVNFDLLFIPSISARSSKDMSALKNAGQLSSCVVSAEYTSIEARFFYFFSLVAGTFIEAEGAPTLSCTTLQGS